MVDVIDCSQISSEDQTTGSFEWRRQQGRPREVGGEVREEESAVCQLQFREEVLRKEKKLLLSTSPGSTQVKGVVKSPNVSCP